MFCSANGSEQGPLLFYSIGRKFNVVIIADLESLDSNMEKTHSLVNASQG